MQVFAWIRNNKLSAFLLLILTVIFLKWLTGSFLGVRTLGYPRTMAIPESGGGYNQVDGLTQKIMPPVPADEYTPQPNVANRMVVEESNLSLLVKNVIDIRNQIVNFAQKAGGYMVSSQVSNPQDAPTATVVIRVPSARLEETLTFLRNQAVKVVSENLSGQDVTDRYVDVDKRIALLEKTLSRYQEILNEAREISDISNLTSQIISIQSQIDSLKGEQEGLTKRAQLAKITVYLSTDEIALPYAPSETWRPGVIFKMAVRSLVSDLRSLATKAIWIAVYAVIWVPLAIAGYLVWKFLSKRTK